MARARTLGIITSSALILTGLGACTGYSSYPHASGSLTRSSTNTRAAKAVMRESLRWTTSRTTGVPERFAVNLPSGVEAETYASIASGVGGEALSSSNADLPRYSITRVWVRSGEAKVDVVRPVLALGKDASGRYPTQGITIELEGGLEPWRVVRYRPWAIGTLADAKANYIDSYAAPDATYAQESDDDSAWREASSETDGAWDDESFEYESSEDDWASYDEDPLPEGGPAEASVPTSSPDVIEINP